MTDTLVAGLAIVVVALVILIVFGDGVGIGTHAVQGAVGLCKAWKRLCQLPLSH